MVVAKTVNGAESTMSPLEGSVPTFRFWISETAKASGVFLENPRKGDAGFDLRAAASVVILAGAQAVIPTGVHCSIPLGWVGVIKDRSSVALRGLHTHAGVIDASYRGEIKILMANRSGESFPVEIGDKIAQMVIIPHLTHGLEARELSELGGSERGHGGFGSTGR